MSILWFIGIYSYQKYLIMLWFMGFELGIDSMVYLMCSEIVPAAGQPFCISM
jgi:hypothetical protein